jgi:hypothetical protein
MTQEFDRTKGKTYLEGSIPFFHTKGETQSEKEFEDEDQ